MSETRYATAGDIWLYRGYVDSYYFLILKVMYSWQSKVYTYNMVNLLTGDHFDDYVMDDTGPIASYQEGWSYLA